MQTLNAVLPFSGFYGTIHSDAIDYAEESLIQDENGEPIEGLAREAYDLFDYSAVTREYAAQYVKDFAETFGIYCKFEIVHSPREYNFTTDRIYADVSLADVRKMLAHVDTARMDRIAAKRHTSRSGFISFYSPNWQTWGDVTEWEPEQLHTLIRAYIEGHANYSEEWEWSLVENYSERLYTWVDSNLTAKGIRFANVASYLRERANRKYG